MTDLVRMLVLLMGLRWPHPPDAHVQRARTLAHQITEAVRAEEGRVLGDTGLPATHLVALVVRAESSFRPHVRGRAGEVGLMQIKLDGPASKMCVDLLEDLEEPVANLRCGIRILLRAQRMCGGPPARWLAAYNGGAKDPDSGAWDNCAGTYGQRVLTPWLRFRAVAAR